MAKKNDSFWAAIVALGASVLTGCDDGRTIAGLVRDKDNQIETDAGLDGATSGGPGRLDAGSTQDGGARDDGGDGSDADDAPDADDGADGGAGDADIDAQTNDAGKDGGDADFDDAELDDAGEDADLDDAGDDDAGEDAGPDPDVARRRRAAALKFLQLQPNGASPPLGSSLVNGAICSGECNGVTGNQPLRAFCDDQCAQINDNSDLRNFCYGGTLCGAITNLDLRQFCYGNCSLIGNGIANLQSLCRGGSSCDLISTDFRLQALCRGDCDTAN